MKKQVLSAVTILSLLCSLAIGGSPVDAGKIKANIPFDFTAGKIKLPSGTYTVDRGVVRGLLLIRAEDRKKNVFVSFIGGQTSKNQSQAKMVFHRYGNQYFLSQVWDEGGTEAMQLPETRAERELARHYNLLAQNNAEPETVIVLAQ